MRSSSIGWCSVLLMASLFGSEPARADIEPDSTTAAGVDSLATARAAIAFPLPPVRSWQVGLLRADRMQHASLTMTIGLAAGLITRSPRIAGYGSLSLGLLKELWDLNSSGFDAIDLLADAAGAGVAVMGTHAVIE